MPIVVVASRILKPAQPESHISVTGRLPGVTIMTLCAVSLLVLAAIFALMRLHRNGEETTSGPVGRPRVIGRFPRVPGELPSAPATRVQGATRSEQASARRGTEHAHEVEAHDVVKGALPVMPGRETRI
jgi:hypothetical protein